MRILTFDGGGVRGAFSARLIERVEQERPGFVDSVELLAGTSVGSFLALLLAKGLKPSEITDIFANRGGEIFKDRGWLDSLSGLDELIQADFDNKALYGVLKEKLGDCTLADLPKKVLVPAFDLDNQDEESKANATRRYGSRFWKPKFMHNFEGPGCDGHLLAVDVAMRSSAAPTYFPSYQGYVDGGVVDNNPSMSALAKAVKVTGLITNHQLLSVGTGFNPHYVPGAEHDWGYKQWLEGKRLINMLFDGMISVPHYQCVQLLDSQYRRLDVDLDEPIDLADVDKIPELLAIADGVDLTDTLAWLDNTWGLGVSA